MEFRHGETNQHVVEYVTKSVGCKACGCYTIERSDGWTEHYACPQHLDEQLTRLSGLPMISVGKTEKSMRDETRFPWLRVAVVSVCGFVFAFGLGLAYFSAGGLSRLIGTVDPPNESTSISALQGRVKALESRLHEQAEWSRTQDVGAAMTRDRQDDTLARLRIDLDGVLARRAPEAAHDANRHEQRIGNLEYATWGKP